MPPSSAPPDDHDGVDREVVRFLAWLKKRGARVKCLYCKKKWGKKGLCAEDIVTRLGEDRIHIQREPSTGERWVILDDLPWADNLMTEFGEEVPHHGQWTGLGK